MKNFALSILLLAILAVPAGCTDPSQVIAVEALKRGVETEDSVVHDLSTMAKQGAIDAGVEKARRAVSEDSPDNAQSAVENTANTFEKVGWLQIQHERARGLIRFGQTFVHSQKGIGDLMLEDLRKAKANAKAKAVPVDSVTPEVPAIAPDPNRSIGKGLQGVP